MKVSLYLFFTLLNFSCTYAFLIQAVLHGAAAPAFDRFAGTSRGGGTHYATSSPLDTSTSGSSGYSPFHASLMKLRDNGIPLLSCDVAKVSNMQAALWTILAELSEGGHAHGACVVMEDMPIPIIQSFADEFNAWKSIPAEADCLEDLRRFNVSVVGNGVGPAIVIETKQQTESSTENEKGDEVKVLNESSVGPISSFFSRISETTQIVTEDDRIVYRLVGEKGMFHMLAVFWSIVCELDQQEKGGPNKIALCFPQVIPDASKDFERFLVVGDLIRRSLSLENTNGTHSLSYFHPSYNRDLVVPSDDYVEGHLLPTEWIRPILQALGKGSQVSAFTDDDLTVQNYLRRSPVPAVLVSSCETKDTSGIEFQGKKDTVKIPQIVVEETIGSIHMANLGKENLQLALDSGMSDIQS